MNFILTIIAIVIFIILEPISFIYVNFIKKPFNWKRLNGYFKTLAIDIDRFGNSQYKSLFNATLIKSNGYQFGDFRETVSSVLGKNEVLSKVTLKELKTPQIKVFKKVLIKSKTFKYRVFIETPYTKVGIFLNRFLNLLHRNHCVLSINNFNNKE